METTVKTGADQAADTLAEKLKAAGWDVRTLRGPNDRHTFSDGRLMLPMSYSVSVYADGPRSAGSPHLSAYWSTITEASFYGNELIGATSFGPTEIYVGGVKRDLATEAEMNAWLDALITVAAALAA